MSNEKFNIDESLEMIRKLLEKEKKNKQKKNTDKIDKKKLLDKDTTKKEKENNKANEKKVSKIIKKENEIITEEENDEYLTEYNVKFQLVVEINKVKLQYFKTIDRYYETIIDSNILLFKDSRNKFIFPTINVGLLNYELEQLREWKNNKVSLQLNDKDNDKVFNLFKKALFLDINKTLESIFKKKTIKIKSITVGKEYAKKEFFIFIEIVNPIEKAKMIKFKTKNLTFGEEKVKPIGINIKELINIAIKYSKNNIEINSEKNPFAPIVLLYLAEFTYRQDNT